MYLLYVFHKPNNMLTHCKHLGIKLELVENTTKTNDVQRQKDTGGHDRKKSKKKIEKKKKRTTIFHFKGRN